MSLATPETIRSLQRKLYVKAKEEPRFRQPMPIRSHPFQLPRPANGFAWEGRDYRGPESLRSCRRTPSHLHCSWPRSAVKHRWRYRRRCSGTGSTSPRRWQRRCLASRPGVSGLAMLDLSDTSVKVPSLLLRQSTSMQLIAAANTIGNPTRQPQATGSRVWRAESNPTLWQGQISVLVPHSGAPKSSVCSWKKTAETSSPCTSSQCHAFPPSATQHRL